MITVSLCNPLSSLSLVLSFLSPLQPPLPSPQALTSFRVLIIGDTRKVNMSFYVKAKTRRGAPNHFIIFLLSKFPQKTHFEARISYGLDTWSLSLCLEVSCLCDIKFLDNLPTTLLSPHSTPIHTDKGDNAKINCEGTGGFMVCVTVAGLAALTPISFSCPIQFCG